MLGPNAEGERQAGTVKFRLMNKQYAVRRDRFGEGARQLLVYQLSGMRS